MKFAFTLIALLSVAAQTWKPANQVILVIEGSKAAHFRLFYRDGSPVLRTDQVHDPRAGSKGEFIARWCDDCGDNR